MGHSATCTDPSGPGAAIDETRNTNAQRSSPVTDRLAVAAVFRPTRMAERPAGGRILGKVYQVTFNMLRKVVERVGVQQRPRARRGPLGDGAESTEYRQTPPLLSATRPCYPWHFGGRLVPIPLPLCWLHEQDPECAR